MEKAQDSLKMKSNAVFGEDGKVNPIKDNPQSSADAGKGFN